MKKTTIVIYKPYMMLSQFRQEVEGQSTLADLNLGLAKDIYPVGRLDADSEGLLLLSSDKSLTDKLLNPKNGHGRVYFVQVEGEPTAEALALLRSGVDIRVVKGGAMYHTSEAKVAVLSEEDVAFLPPRLPAVRFRANIPTTWLSLELGEGKNRQVRKMTAAVGLPTLRLVRVSIGGLRLADLGLVPSAAKMLTEEELELVYS
jgi:23S rRNA pseudouridine2457 synthase